MPSFKALLVIIGMCEICSAQNGTLRVMNTIQPPSCPANVEEKRDSLKAEVQHLLENSVLVNSSAPAPGPHADRPCGCGGPGWTKVIDLDMSDPTQQCPGDLATITSPVRGCHQTGSCISAVFQVGRTYSQVCGQVNAYQYGTPDAFFHAIHNGPRTIEQEYMGGVSLTHGPVGSRQHIWSFVAALSEITTDFYYDSNRFGQKCACTDTTKTWPYSTPSFVGNDYFCDTGNLGPGWSYTTYYTNNPMWDGEGCGPTSSCCQFNNPPWFCKTLPQAASDQVELRICGSSHERTIVYLAEIFVR